MTVKLADQVRVAIDNPKQIKMTVLRNKSPELFHAVMEATKDFPEEMNLSDRLLFIEAGVMSPPVCKKCGVTHSRIAGERPSRFVAEHCSLKCYYADREVMRNRVSGVDQETKVAKMASTNMKKYGHAFNSQREDVKKTLKRDRKDRVVFVEEIELSHKKPVPSKEVLLAEYSKQGATISSLARMFETSNPTVRKWLIEYGIDRKSHAEAIREVKAQSRVSLPERESFLNIYENGSLKDIQTTYGIGQETAYEWLEYFGITPRSVSGGAIIGKAKQFAHMQFSKEEVEAHYQDDVPLIVLAQRLGVSMSKVKSLIKEHNIEVRVPYRSGGEMALYDFCKEVAPDDDWQHTNRSLINPFELDIVNHTKKIAIEYCGIYWHSETFMGRGRSYHSDKRKRCEEKGYKLITVFESDDMQKVYSLVKTAVGKNQRIYARDTVVKEVPKRDAIDFHNAHHLSGSVGSSHDIGLYHGDNLVMVMSFGKPRFTSKYDLEITRMTSHSEYTVVGGASKLFKNFIKQNGAKSFLTYADFRFGDGKVYEKIGFKRLTDTQPNYWYFKPSEGVLYSRVKFQKHKLADLLTKFDPELSEYDNMIVNGWGRIWDCGNGAYEYNA